MLHWGEWSDTLLSKLYGRRILLAYLVNDLVITAFNLWLNPWWLAYEVARLVFFIRVLYKLVYNPIKVLAILLLQWLVYHIWVHCVDFCYLWNFLVNINKHEPVNALFILKKTLECLFQREAWHELNLYCSFLKLILICIKLSKIVHYYGHFLRLL